MAKQKTVKRTLKSNLKNLTPKRRVKKVNPLTGKKLPFSTNIG